MAKPGWITHGDPFTLNVGSGYDLKKGVLMYLQIYGGTGRDRDKETERKRSVYYVFACEEVPSK